MARATTEPKPSTDAFVEQLFAASVGMFDLLCIYMGDRLGLYRALDEGPATPAELASRAGLHERSTREWLEQQAASSLILVDDPGAPHSARRYTLPAEHAEALLDPESPASMIPLVRALVACAHTLPALLDGFRSGEGVPWSAFGPEMIEAQGDFNRPWLVGSLGIEHLPAIPDVHERLLADPPARVADVACGVGWAAIAIAKAYPKVTVHGIDLDAPSIELARRNATDAGVADRVTFDVMDAGDPSLEGVFDLAIVIEAVHDLSRPVDVLAATRRTLAPGGTLLVADEATEDEFTVPASDMERLFYGFSVLCCLPASLADQPSEATGTVMRPSTMREYAERAGFSGFETLPHELGFQRFYRLDP